MTISSFFSGRIRLRSAVLKDDEISLALQKAVEWHESVKKIERNALTGSVLIEYDPKKLPVSALSALTDELLLLKKLCEHFDGKNKDEILKKIDSLKEKLS